MTVRIESVPSGKVSHLGLKYIFDMTTDYVLPEGTSYVEGSARFVGRSGTTDVLPGAHVSQTGGKLRVVLPAHVPNGSDYTPPSVEFELLVTAPPGAELALRFQHYQVTAHVFLLGDVHTSCEPDPHPITIGLTRVEAAAR